MSLEDLSHVAFPRDPDLTCHLTGLKLTSVVTLGRETLLRFSVADAAGWWAGQSMPVREHGHFELVVPWPGGIPEAVARMTGRLEVWRDRGTLLELAQAPGRLTWLSDGPRHGIGEHVLLPR